LILLSISFFFFLAGLGFELRGLCVLSICIVNSGCFSSWIMLTYKENFYHSSNCNYFWWVLFARWDLELSTSCHSLRKLLCVCLHVVFGLVSMFEVTNQTFWLECWPYSYQSAHWEAPNSIYSCSVRNFILSSMEVYMHFKILGSSNANYLILIFTFNGGLQSPLRLITWLGFICIYIVVLGVHCGIYKSSCSVS
jgi:hypothetical protein